MVSLTRQRAVVMLAAGAATVGGFLDQTIIGVALPTMTVDLGLDSDEALWAVVAYLLPLAAFAAAFGALGRHVGQRPMFVVGIIGFALGSLGAGLSVDGTMLAVARFIQGLAAAAMFTASQAMVANAFPRDRRGRGIALYTAITTIALSSGPLIGGLLVETLGWRWVFFVNPILSLLALPYILGLASGLPEVRRESVGGRFDTAGLITLIASLTLVSYGLIQLSLGNPTDPIIPLILAVVGAGLVGVFLVVERRAPNPIIPVGQLTRPVFSAALMVIVAVGFVQMWGVIAFPAYMQDALGMSPFLAGAGLLPLTLALTFGQFFAGRAVDRFGPRKPIVGGLGLAGVGLIIMLASIPTRSYWGFVPAFTLAGLGLALCQTPANTAAMNEAGRQDRLMASGVLGTARQTSALTGLVVLSALSGIGASRFTSAPAQAALAFGLLGGMVVLTLTLLVAGTRLRPFAGERLRGPEQSPPLGHEQGGATRE